MNKNKKGLYFLKDKKVKLITEYNTPDGMGGLETGYRYITNNSLWAYTSQLSQDLAVKAMSLGTEEKRLFVLNYRDDLKVFDFIEYKGNYYLIVRLDTADDYNGELFVYVRDAEGEHCPDNVQPAQE